MQTSNNASKQQSSLWSWVERVVYTAVASVSYIPLEGTPSKQNSSEKHKNNNSWISVTETSNRVVVDSNKEIS